MHHRFGLALTLVGAASLFGCASSTDGTSVDLPADGGSLTNGDASTPTDAAARPVDAGLPLATGELGCTKMDVLFVIDNSGSMAQEQAALADNFPRMVEVLDQLRGGVIDYRVGVTTTSFGASFFGLTVPSDDGQLLKSPDMTNAWLARGEADLTARFSTLATVGVTGNADEQPLRAAREAVTSRVTDGKNAGFFRKDALLAIVFITDEDDGSSADSTLPIPGLAPLIPVADLKASIDTAAGGPGRWAAAAIAGDGAGGCSSAYGDATEAERMREFVGLLGNNGVMGNICSGMLSAELATALDTFTAACEQFPILR